MPLSGLRLIPVCTQRLMPLSGQTLIAYTQGSMPQSGERLTPEGWETLMREQLRHYVQREQHILVFSNSSVFSSLSSRFQRVSSANNSGTKSTWARNSCFQIIQYVFLLVSKIQVCEQCRGAMCKKSDQFSFSEILACAISSYLLTGQTYLENCWFWFGVEYCGLVRGHQAQIVFDIAFDIAVILFSEDFQLASSIGVEH